MASAIPPIREQIATQLATVASLTGRVHQGRPSGRMKVNVLAVGPRAWVYFRREDFQVLSKGTSGRALKCTAQFGIEIWAIPPAVGEDETPGVAALEDLMDELSLSAKQAIETDVKLGGLAQLATVKEREVDIDGSTDTDLGAASIIIEVVYISTEGD